MEDVFLTRSKRLLQDETSPIVIALLIMLCLILAVCFIGILIFVMRQLLKNDLPIFDSVFRLRGEGGASRSSTLTPEEVEMAIRAAERFKDNLQLERYSMKQQTFQNPASMPIQEPFPPHRNIKPVPPPGPPPGLLANPPMPYKQSEHGNASLYDANNDISFVGDGQSNSQSLTHFQNEAKSNLASTAKTVEQNMNDKFGDDKEGQTYPSDFDDDNISIRSGTSKVFIKPEYSHSPQSMKGRQGTGVHSAGSFSPSNTRTGSNPSNPGIPRYYRGTDIDEVRSDDDEDSTSKPKPYLRPPPGL